MGLTQIGDETKTSIVAGGARWKPGLSLSDMLWAEPAVETATWSVKAYFGV